MPVPAALAAAVAGRAGWSVTEDHARYASPAGWSARVRAAARPTSSRDVWAVTVLDAAGAVLRALTVGDVTEAVRWAERGTRR